jgi:hypothetical protein
MLTCMQSPTRRRSSPAHLALALFVALGSIVAAPSPAEAASYRLNLYREGDFVQQTNLVQCVGASMQMMINMIATSNNRSAARQLELQELARLYSNRLGPPRPDRRGASVRGWAAGLNDEGFGPYQVVGYATIDDAMRAAARAIRTTQRPVGLLVWRGRHAWVMSGFQATGDPLKTNNFKVTHAYVLDPLYPGGSPTWGRSPRPGTRLTVATLGEDFVKRRSGSSANAWSSPSLAGKWVLVLPVDRPPLAHPITIRIV